MAPYGGASTKCEHTDPGAAEWSEVGANRPPGKARGYRVRMGGPAAGPGVRGRWVARVWEGRDTPGRVG